MIKTIILSFIVVAILVGTVVLLLALKGRSERAKEEELSGNTETSSVSTDAPETEPDESKFITLSLSEEDMHRGDLILVNAGNPYLFSEKTELKDLYSGRKKYDNGARAFQVSTTDLKLSEEVLDKLNALTEAFYEASGERGLLVKSAYRSYEEQKEILDYRIERDGEEEALKKVALPGESEHHTGRAFDMSVYKDGVNTYIQDEPDYLPVYEDAHKYGFILRYPEDKVAITGIDYESWHFRYVGVPHAYYMYTEGLCLEEYILLLAEEYKYDGTHLFIDCDDGNRYEVYYVPALGSGKTDVIIPADCEYEVSGNNVDGFIVTAKIG